MSLLALYDVAAPAKLNLFLHVTGRRADGLHLLQSVLVLIDWCDTLHFELRGDGRLSRHDLGAALPPDDLCLRAARLLQAEAGSALGADISIEKLVPWGAGMGGGSSDAASILLALNRLWGLHWPRARLQALGLKLGADVPFFLGGRNALVEGIGERLTPLLLPASRLAVLKPEAGIETRAIFASPRLVRDSQAVIVAGFITGEFHADGCERVSALQVLQGFGRNDLQPVAQDHCAEVGHAAALLQARFGNSRMTGSGSAVFARVAAADGIDAGAMPELPLVLPPRWTGRMCRSLDEHPLLGWAQDE